MLIGLLELRQTIQQHVHLYLFAIFVMITWALWLLKVLLARHYRPWVNDYSTTTTVVIPVVISACAVGWGRTFGSVKSTRVPAPPLRPAAR